MARFLLPLPARILLAHFGPNPLIPSGAARRGWRKAIQIRGHPAGASNPPMHWSLRHLRMAGPIPTTQGSSLKAITNAWTRNAGFAPLVGRGHRPAWKSSTKAVTSQQRLWRGRPGLIACPGSKGNRESRPSLSRENVVRNWTRIQDDIVQFSDAPAGQVKRGRG